MKNVKPDNALTKVRNDLAEAALGEQFLSLQTTDILSIRELPRDSAKVNAISASIDAKIWYDFAKTRLSDAEREAVKQAQGSLSDLDPSIRAKFDYYLHDAAQQYGTILFNSVLVRQRLWSWQYGEKGGDRKLKTLLDEIYRSVLVRLGRAKGRISLRHKIVKPAWIAEITELQIRVRKEWPDTSDAVRQLINDVIEASPKSFPYLTNNKASLLFFLDDSRAMAFRGRDFKRVRGDLTPTKFFHEWVAAAEGRDPESVRQSLSAL